MGRNAVQALVLVLLAYVSTARADDAAVEKVATGKRLYFAAEVGTTPDLIGMGVERDLQPSAGHRVYPENFVSVPANDYNAVFAKVETKLDLDANAHYLFAKAGINASSDKRYMVVRVEQVNKVLKLSPTSKPLDTAPMFASKTFYGWALYVLIRGMRRTSRPTWLRNSWSRVAVFLRQSFGTSSRRTST